MYKHILIYKFYKKNYNESFFGGMTLFNYFCSDIKKLKSRGATAIADAENRPMEPETDNADEGKLASLETGLCLPAAVLVLRVFLWPCSVPSATPPRIRLL